MFALVATAYWALGVLGATDVAGVLALTTLWLPAAIGPGCLARWPHLWPGVLGGIVVAEVAVDVPLYSSSAMQTSLWVVGNLTAAVVGATVLHRRGAVVLEQPRQVGDLALAALLAGAVFGFWAALASNAPMTTFLSTLRGDALGIVIALPTILMVGRRHLAWTTLGTAAWVATVSACAAMVFLRPGPSTSPVDPWAVLLLLAVVFMTAWTGIVGIAFCMPALVLFGIWGTRLGRGPFAGVDVATGDSLALAQAILFVTVLGLYAVALVWDSSRRSMREALHSTGLLLAVVEAVPGTIRIEELLASEPAVDPTSSITAYPTAEDRYERVHRAIARDPAGVGVALVEATIDITAEVRLEQRSRAMYEQSPIAMARVGLDGVVLDANLAFLGLAGAGPDSVVGQPLTGLVARRGDEWLLRRGNGQSRWTEVHVCRLDDSGPSPSAYDLYSFIDVTQRRVQQAELQRRATTDELTGLLNRSALMSDLSDRLSVGDAVAVLLFDIDDLKRINDVLGHRVGDDVVTQMARRLEQALPTGGCLARLGGDEFVAVLSAQTEGSVERWLSAVRSGSALPLHVGLRSLRVTVSIGVAMSAAGQSTAEDLLRHADLAMFEAKRAGKDAAVRYQPHMGNKVSRALVVEAMVKDAIESGSLRAHLQAIVTASGRELVGFEVLARLTGPVTAPPAEFIAVAESTGMVSAVAAQVIGDALDTIRSHDQVAAHVTINASPMELSRPDYARWLAQLLEVHQMDPGRVVVEITESAALDASGVVLEVLTALRGMGVRLAIDDFGTGYSSLTALRDLPVDFVKLDQSFVSELPGSAGSAAICAGVISVAHELGIRVVAEGVETEDQARCLNEMGCDMLQGYLLHRPEPTADALVRFMHPSGGEPR